MRRAEKPLDVGSGAVCASFDSRSAAWLSIGAPDPALGWFELAAAPSFDERSRGDPQATRRYRRELERPEHAVLAVELDGQHPQLRPIADAVDGPRWVGPGVHVAAAAPAASTVVQRWRFGVAPMPRRATLRLRGRIDRPALAEITETDPPSRTATVATLHADGAAVTVGATGIGRQVRFTAVGLGVRWTSTGADITGHALVPPDGGELTLTATVGGVPPQAILPAASPTGLGLIVDRALSYVRGCTAVALTRDERAIVTDHRLLPLSWTRDAYWQALLLLAADGDGDRDRVADHLRWMWRRCDRPRGTWARSHHANGARKDLGFQADQQLYPLLELADYWRLTARLPGGVAWDVEVARTWTAIERELDAEHRLLGTTETAADDPAVVPFLASPQVLLWYAAGRIAEVAEHGALSLDPDRFTAVRQAIAEAFIRHFVRDGEPWPYGVDGFGRRIAYHDANDLPIALAPLWGFCAPDDQGWRATMRFAFGPDNPGWVDGRHAGLGSIHTPGPWTLGDVQAWLVARVSRDIAGTHAALARMEGVAFADGMLPEAYDADGDGRIRTWFAWPGAALGALRLLDAAGRLEDILRVLPG